MKNFLICLGVSVAVVAGGLYTYNKVPAVKKALGG